MGLLSHKRFLDQQGAVLVLVAVLMLVFIGVTALAVDVGNMVVVRNELQNAADAGALAGATQLYYRESAYPMAPDPAMVGWVNPDANRAAEIAAKKNWSLKEAVEVTIDGNNCGDVQRGHWSLWERKFYPLDSLAPITLAGYSAEQLDHMDGQNGTLAFINAVRVITHRKDKALPSLFSRIFGYQSFGMSAEAVAYLGYPDSFPENFFGAPMVICLESILDDDGNYSCGQGRLINSSSKSDANTAGWTDYSECSGSDEVTLNLDNIMKYDEIENTCNGTNSNGISGSIAVGGGQVNSAFSALRNCSGFNSKLGSVRDQPLDLRVAVAKCSGGGTIKGNVKGCMEIVGATTLRVVLITDTFPATGEKKYDDIPPVMGEPGDPNPFRKDPNLSGEENWINFVEKFDLHIDRILATDLEDLGYYQKTVYALPSCEFQPPAGKTGGSNTGIMAAIPVLVKGSINY
jgi:hypothetical protein